MKDFICALVVLSLLAMQMSAQEEPPIKVLGVLENITKIERGYSLGQFFAGAEIAEDVVRAGGAHGHGTDFLLWHLGDSGKWFIRTVSRRAVDTNGKPLTEKVEEGLIVSVSVLYNTKSSEMKSWQEMTKLFPCYCGHKLFRNKAEQCVAAEPHRFGP